ncbi:MAG: hypothetical protein JST04_09580 [Bdellovibrionales bacterium]|nr:hypothetical protein [Bdellovibrionales bacterium]
MGAPRQDRTRSLNIRYLLLAGVTFSLVAGMAYIESRRSHALARAHRAAESRELDDRFGREFDRLEMRLQELKTQAIRAIPFADRRRYPSGVVSASVWTKAPSGVVRSLGFEAEGVWEQALYRVLPAEIAKRTGAAVLPLVGPELANDPSGETLRLGLFPDADGVHVAAIAFRPHALFAAGIPSGGVKTYLIEDSGLILAHTNAAEVGTRTSALADLYRRSSHRISSKSWEGFPTTIRFERVPGWNAFLVMEKVHAPVRASTNPLLILIFISGSLLGILFLGLAIIRPRKPPVAGLAPIVPEVALETAPIPVRTFVPRSAPVTVAAPTPEPRRGLRELRENPPRFIPRAPAVEAPSLAAPVPTNAAQTASDPAVPNSELARFLTARKARSETAEQNRLRREKILLEEFETEARRAKGRERLETKIVESVSSATKSPALFFRYDPLQGIARLSAEAGYPASRSILGAGGMSFALETGLVTEIHAEVARGRALNLWEYPPLVRVMLTRLGIANFEAWPMTEARNPHAGPPRLLGVLVVAESGVDSVLHREFMGALLERASRHYARQDA